MKIMQLDDYEQKYDNHDDGSYDNKLNWNMFEFDWSSKLR
jgi:hypothetical protein